MTLRHRRLGHMSEKGVAGVGEIGVARWRKAHSLEFCENYVLGKATRVKFDTTSNIIRDVKQYSL